MSTTQSIASNGTQSASSDYATIRLSGLKVGATLQTPIYEERADRDILLLTSGITITTALLEQLEKRGVSSVRVHKSELERLTGGQQSGGGSSTQTQQASVSKYQAAQSAKRAEQVTEKSSSEFQGISTSSFVNQIKKQSATSYDHKTVGKIVESYQGSVTQVEDLFASLSDGATTDTAQMVNITGEALTDISVDLDVFVALGIKPASDKYPCKHSLQRAMLAMSMGTLLGLSQEELTELGVGCIIHDAGMLQLNPQLLNSDKVLNKVQFLEITKHPNLTFDMIKTLPNLTKGSRMVAYQMHKRLNGSGYPRQRTAKQIHYLAKIAMVADVFVALISPRPHRQGLLPYEAMEHVLQGVQIGLYDPKAVRALLHTVSLFPIGSYVQMNDSRVGKVVRSNRDAYTTPVVELWLPGQDNAETNMVDLSKTPGLHIELALPESEVPKPDSITAAELEFVADCWE